MKKRLYIIQERCWLNGKWTKWKYNTDWCSFIKSEVEYSYMENFNDPIGNTVLDDLKGRTRIKSIMVELK